MRLERLLGLAATAVVVVAIIGGLMLIEGPGTARADRFDRERIANLNAVAQYVDDYYRVNGAMPDDLTALQSEFNFERASTDPRTGETYEYEPMEEDSYRLCAVFETEGPHEFISYSRAVLEWPNHERHISPTVAEGSGRQCFEILILEKAK